MPRLRGPVIGPIDVFRVRVETAGAMPMNISAHGTFGVRTPSRARRKPTVAVLRLWAHSNEQGVARDPRNGFRAISSNNDRTMRGRVMRIALIQQHASPDKRESLRRGLDALRLAGDHGA